MNAVKLLRLWPFVVIAAMGLWAARLDYLRADYRLTLANERAAWSGSIADADRARLTAQAHYAEGLATAAQGYAADLANRQPIILRSRDTVTRYAQTDAGRALCRDADRVRDIDAIDAALARNPATASDSGGTVPPDGTASPAGR